MPDGATTTDLELPEWLLAMRPSEMLVDSTKTTVRSDRDIQVGAIYEAAQPESATSDREVVLVTLVGESHAEVCLLHYDTDMATDRDLVVDFEETGCLQPLVLQANVVGVVWFAQLGDRLGKVEAELLDLLPALSEGRYVDRFGLNVGLPLEGVTDPRWLFLEQQIDALHGICWDCTVTLLDGGSWWDKWRDPITAECIAQDCEAGYVQTIVTIPEALTPDAVVCGTRVAHIDENHPGGVLDPSIFDADLLADRSVVSRLVELLDTPGVTFAPALLRRFTNEELLALLDTSINKNALRDALVRGLGGGRTNRRKPEPPVAPSKSAVLNITVVEREEEGVLTAA